MKKLTAALRHTHWTTKLLVKYGSLFSTLLLVAGSFAEKGSFLAVSFCQTAVYTFSISLVGGILLDVIAYRKGMREE